MNEAIVQECRGLILDEADYWRVVCRPYDKFFNYGEPNAIEIEWGTASVYEKLDGSLMTLYHYRGGWHVATSGTPDASGPAHGCGQTFAELFWKTWSELGYSLPTHTGRVYMFELMTPWNTIIVRHRQSRIVLHGCREIAPPYREIPPGAAAEDGWEIVKSHPLGSWADVLAAAGAIDPMRGEGYVVCDSQFRRIKVKSPRYVALAHLKDGLSPRRLLEIIRRNESAEFLAHFPEWTDAYAIVRAKFDAMCNELESEYSRLKEVAVQKEFAAQAMKARISSPLFAMRAGKCRSVREFFATSTLPALERTIGLDGVELFPAANDER